MELQGIIYAVASTRQGVGRLTGNEWKICEYVIEDEHQRKAVFEVFGSDKIDEWHLSVGDAVRVFIDVDAREYNGRWYNTLRAWKVERVGAEPQPQRVSDTLDFLR